MNSPIDTKEQRGDLNLQEEKIAFLPLPRNGLGIAVVWGRFSTPAGPELLFLGEYVSAKSLVIGITF